MTKNNIEPEHYKTGGLEVIDIMKLKLTKQEFKGFCKGLIIKYILRADNKNKIEDYKKAQWYLNYLIKTMEEQK